MVTFYPNQYIGEESTGVIYSVQALTVDAVFMRGLGVTYKFSREALETLISEGKYKILPVA